MTTKVCEIDGLQLSGNSIIATIKYISMKISNVSCVAKLFTQQNIFTNTNRLLLYTFIKTFPMINVTKILRFKVQGSRFKKGREREKLVIG